VPVQPEDAAEEPQAAVHEEPGATTTQEEAAGKKGKKGKKGKGKNNKQQEGDEEEERMQQEQTNFLEQLRAEDEQTPAKFPADERQPPFFPEPQIPSAADGFGPPSDPQGATAGGGGDWGFEQYEDELQDELADEPPKLPTRSPYRTSQEMTAQWANEPYASLDSHGPAQASPKQSPSRAAAQLPSSQFDFSQPTHPADTFKNNWFNPPAQSSSKSMPPLPHTAAHAHPSPKRSPMQIPQEPHHRPTAPGPRPAPVPIEGLATKAEALVHQYAPDPAEYRKRIVQVRAPERNKPEDSEFLRRVGGKVKPDVVFLRRHFHGEGKLSESQAIWILEKAAEIFQAEPNVLDVEAPVTSKSLSAGTDALPY